MEMKKLSKPTAFSQLAKTFLVFILITVLMAARDKLDEKKIGPRSVKSCASLDKLTPFVIK